MAKDDKKPPAQPSARDALLQYLQSADLTVAAGNARQPLGPPQAYYQDQADFMAGGGRPRDPNFTPYIEGQQWEPAYNLPPEDRDRLKARMNAAGLYGTSGYQSGSWTREDSNAYQQVLEAANAMGVADPQVVIDNISDEVRKGPRVSGPRAPLVSKISNPDDIRAVIKDSAFSLIGQRLSAAEEDRLVAMYQQREQAENQATYNAGAAGGTVTGAGSMQSFAESQIEALRPKEVGVHQHLAAFEKILGSLGTQVDLTQNYQGKGLPTATGTEVL